MICEKCKQEINPTEEFYNVIKTQCFVDDWREEEGKYGTYCEEEADFGAMLSIKKICNNCIPDQIKEDFKVNESYEVYCKKCDKLAENREIYYTVDRLINYNIEETIYYCEKHLPKI